MNITGRVHLLTDNDNDEMLPALYMQNIMKEVGIESKLCVSTDKLFWKDDAPSFGRKNSSLTAKPLKLPVIWKKIRKIIARYQPPPSPVLRSHDGSLITDTWEVSIILGQSVSAISEG